MLSILTGPPAGAIFACSASASAWASVSKTATDPPRVSDTPNQYPATKPGLAETRGTSSPRDSCAADRSVKLTLITTACIGLPFAWGGCGTSVPDAQTPSQSATSGGVWGACDYGFALAAPWASLLATLTAFRAAWIAEP